MAALRRFARRLRFAALEGLLLPAVAPLFRALMSTWPLRIDPTTPASIEQLAAHPRVVVGTCHGMMLHVLALSRLPALRGRRFVVLLSPSRDGRLLAAFLTRFGIGHAVGATGSSGVAGARAFANRVAAGDIGVVGVDGPRGPCCQVSSGWLRLAAAADAAPYLFVTSASHGLTFGSWDRAHLPAPFATVSCWSAALPRSTGHAGEEVVALAQTRLLEGARQLATPVLPPGLARRR